MAREGDFAEAVELYGSALHQQTEGRLTEAAQTLESAKTLLSWSVSGPAGNGQDEFDPDLDPSTACTGWCLVVLSLASVREQMGENDSAAELFEAVVPILDELETPAGHLFDSRLQSRAGRGRVARKQGHYRTAQEDLVLACEMVKAQGTQETVAAAMLGNELGMVYKYTAQYAAGIAVYEQARQTLYTLQGPVSSELATVLHNLGGIYFSSGDYAQAADYARQGLEMRQSLVGPDDPAVAADAAALAAILQQLGQYDEARTVSATALSIFQRALGPDDIEVGMVCHNLGALHASCGDMDRAEECYGRALSIKIRLLGADHPEVGGTLHNLGVLQKRRGELQEAFRTLERAHGVLSTALGEDHPATRASLKELQGLQPCA